MNFFTLLLITIILVLTGTIHIALIGLAVIATLAFLYWMVASIITGIAALIKKPLPPKPTATIKTTYYENGKEVSVKKPTAKTTDYFKSMM